MPIKKKHPTHKLVPFFEEKITNAEILIIEV
jgi:hypothetical protein